MVGPDLLFADPPVVEEARWRLTTGSLNYAGASAAPANLPSTNAAGPDTRLDTLSPLGRSQPAV